MTPPAARVLAIASSLLLAAGVHAQPPAADAAPPAPRAAAPALWRPALPITRSDVARAYMTLERSINSVAPQGPLPANVHRDFDQLTFRFFRGEMSEAVAAVHALDDLVLKADPGPDERLARSLKADLEPPVWIIGSNEPIRVRVVSLYRADLGIEPARPIRWSLRIRPESGGPATDWPITGSVSARRADVDAEGVVNLREQFPKAPGRYSVQVVAGDLGSAIIGTLNVVDRSPSSRREALRERLTAARTAHPPLTRAVDAGLARAGLLNDSPSLDSSAEFLADPQRLASEIDAETTAIEQGTNPYRERTGDFWMGVAVGPSGTLPVRVYSPSTADAAASPRPLVIAIHGAGGDENMFMDAYGSGLIRTLADRHGFIVASPRGEMLATTPAAFAALLDTLTEFYTIDPQRIYVVGHSMGGMIAGQIASRASDRVAAVVGLAGGPRGAVRPPTAPILLIGAEADIVIPAAGLATTARTLSAAGVNITYRGKPAMGHTLMVRDTLPEAIDWLLEHRLAPPRPAPPLVPGTPAQQNAPETPAKPE
jgi:predicted esterase